MAFIEKPLTPIQEAPAEEISSNQEAQDGVEIASLLMRQKLDVFSNGLLGEFDASGAYSISDKIIKELVAMAKVVTNKDDKTLYLVAKAGNQGEEFSIKFILQIHSDGELKTATLKVLEKCDRANGVFSNTVSCFVAKYTDEDNEFFLTKVFTILNIITDGEDSQMLSMNNQLAPSIILLKNKHRAMKIKLAGMTAIDKKFFEERLALLKKSGAYGSFVLRQFAILARENAGKLPMKSESKYYRIMNEILDNCFERAGAIKDNNIKAEFAKINSAFRDAVQQAEASLSAPTVKKPSAEKSTPASAGAPSGGGGGGKSDGGAKGGGKDGGGGGGKSDAKVSTLGQYLDLRKTNQVQQTPKAPKQKAPKQKVPDQKDASSSLKNIEFSDKIFAQVLNDIKNSSLLSQEIGKSFDDVAVKQNTLTTNIAKTHFPEKELSM